MRSGGRIFVAALALAPLAACGMVDGRNDSRPKLAAGQPAPVPSGEAYDDLPEAPMAPDEPAPVAAPMSDEQTVLGAPYMIDGKSYTPAPANSLDEVGYAAMLWETADGHRTATGETYSPATISAAHRTLPLPSYVEVTSLDSGKTILVRVNDRGPMLNDRIIALSPAAARQLDLPAHDGTAAVRVRKVSPTEQDRAVLRGGGKVPERMDTPAGLRTALIRKLPAMPAPLAGPVRTLSVAPAMAAAPPAKPAAAGPGAVATTSIPPAKPAAPAKLPVVVPEAPGSSAAIAAAEPGGESAPQEPIRKVVPVQHSTPPARAAAPAPAPAASTRPAPAQPVSRQGAYVVQVAALSSRPRADALARAVGGYVMPVGSLFRVRTGPYRSDAAARGALGSIRAKGYAEARVMANDAR